MKVNIKSINQVESLVLCKLSKIPIMELPTSTIVSIERTIDEVDKMTLKINKYVISQDSKKKVENLAYKEVKTKRYLLLNDSEYFIIEEIKDNKITGNLEVVAYSGEQILMGYPLDIESIGVQILNDDLDNNIYSLNTLLIDTGWSLNYVDDSIMYNEDGSDKMRWYESINMDYLEFIRDLSDKFDFLPIFDTFNRKIDLVSMSNLGEEIKIVLSRDNYIKSKEKTNNSEKLITLLKLKGSDELDIGYHMVSGYNFLTNFSYFKDVKEMSEELIFSLNEYDRMVKIRSNQWRQLVDEKTEKETELALNRTRWQISISSIDCHKNLISRYSLSEMVIEENEERVKLSQEMDNELILRLKIEDLLNEIKLLQEGIDNINVLCQYPTATNEEGELIFNEDSLNELRNFIFIDTYQDDTFVDANALIEKGKSVLEERCKPEISVEIDSVNFMNRLIDNNLRLKFNGTLSFGDIIILLNEDDNTEEFFYFLGYNIDYKNNQLTLEISNKKSLRKNTRTINEYLKEMKKTKSLMMNNRYLFNKVKENRLNIGKDDVL